jgi:Hint domain
MLDRSEGRNQWRRTRRSILAMSGILLGATVSGINGVSARELEREHEREHGDRHDRGHDFDFGFDHDRGCDFDDHGGPACYLKGTHIRTPLGERKIEDLRSGDLVITLGGRAKPIEWIGGRRYERRPGQSWGAAVRPVRVGRDALGPDVPHADLFLSQEHCLSFDGGLIRVADLLNGTSICRDPRSEFTEIEYLHIRLGAHDVIYAEGAAAETLWLNPISVEKCGDLLGYERLFRASADERPCAPLYSKVARGRQGQLLSHLRSAVSPWFDRRTPFDRIRDRLWDRADAVAA